MEKTKYFFRCDVNVFSWTEIYGGQNIILNGFKTYIYVLIYILKMAKNILVENVFMYIVLFYILKYI